MDNSTKTIVIVVNFNGKEFIADKISISEIEKYIPPSTFIVSTKNSSNEKLSQETASLLKSDFFILDTII